MVKLSRAVRQRRLSRRIVSAVSSRAIFPGVKLVSFGGYTAQVDPGAAPQLEAVQKVSASPLEPSPRPRATTPFHSCQSHCRSPRAWGQGRVHECQRRAGVPASRSSRKWVCIRFISRSTPKKISLSGLMALADPKLRDNE